MQDFPVYSVNGNHDRTEREHCHETRKKRPLKNFMTYAMQEEKQQQCECNGVFSLRQDFPVYSVNGNHARAVRQRCRETRKKRC